jgi:ABC-type sugar transport system permease subunit
LSFFEWDFLNPAKFVGFQNFDNLWQDPLFWNGVKNTLFYCISIPIVVGLALFVAAAVNSLEKGQAFYRSAYFMSTAISFVAAGIILRLTMQTDFGIINWVLGSVGIPPVPWLQNSWWARIAVILVTVWKNLGWYMLVLLAGIQSIDSALYDAAAIDGANMFQRFRNVTIPGLRPVLIFSGVMATLDALQTFPQVMALTGGGPARATEPILYLVYQEAFSSFHVGYAAAEAMVLFAFILLVSLGQIRVFSKD